ncbi:hypothetical protein OROGR_031033 [Orobanche gracilis]
MSTSFTGIDDYSRSRPRFALHERMDQREMCQKEKSSDVVVHWISMLPFKDILHEAVKSVIPALLCNAASPTGQVDQDPNPQGSYHHDDTLLKLADFNIGGVSCAGSISPNPPGGGMDGGHWSSASRKVYLKSWSAIYVPLDNVRTWKLRSEIWATISGRTVLSPSQRMLVGQLKDIHDPFKPEIVRGG